MKQKIAQAAIWACIILNSYGLVALVVFNSWMMLAYLALALLGIPLFIVMRLLSPAGVWTKTAAERTPFEQQFIRIYDVNMVLVFFVLVGFIVMFYFGRHPWK